MMEVMCRASHAYSDKSSPLHSQQWSVSFMPSKQLRTGDGGQHTGGLLGPGTAGSVAGTHNSHNSHTGTHVVVQICSTEAHAASVGQVTLYSLRLKSVVTRPGVPVPAFLLHCSLTVNLNWSAGLSTGLW